MFSLLSYPYNSGNRRKEHIMKKYIVNHKFQCLQLLFFTFLKTIGTVGVAAILSVLIDTISASIAAQNASPLVHCGYICFLYAIALGGIVLLTERLKAAYVKAVMLSIRQDTFHGILAQSIGDYSNKNSAEYITLLNQSLGTLEENYLKNLFSIGEALISIAASVLLLLCINPVIAIISILAMSIPSLIPKLFGNKIGGCQSRIMQTSSAYTAKIKDVLTGYEIVKSFHVESQMQDKHQESASKLETSKQSMSNTMAALYGITNMASIFVQFAIMLLAGLFAVNGIITIGNIIAITQLTGQVISPAFQLSAKISQLKSTKPIQQQIKEITSHEALKADFQELTQTLRVENLSFSYESKPILENIQYLFEYGKKYAIIGESGSGKSTLLKILAGYYDSYEGKIAVDGNEHAICDCTVIHQNVFLFDDSIRNNLTLYQPFSDADICRALRLAGLEPVIAALPNGIETQVEENGSRFSGGERQRIAIARAILHKKSLLLMDEVTSSLDHANSMEIEKNLLALPDTTCICITHKLDDALASKYDAILEMKHGRLKPA